MLVTTFDKSAMQGVSKVLEDLGANIKVQMSAAVSKTAAKVRIATARRLKRELAVPVRILKKVVVKGKTDKETMTAFVYLNRGYPIPLKHFGAKEYRKGKGGVTYRISPGGARSIMRDAFMPPQYGGNVYRRKGADRGPLVKQVGPAPGDLFEKAGVVQLALDTANEELPKQIQERVRFLTLKAQGKLKGKQA